MDRILAFIFWISHRSRLLRQGYSFPGFSKQWERNLEKLLRIPSVDQTQDPCRSFDRRQLRARW
jgi:hypothetical protein